MSSQEAQGARRSAENPAEPAARPLRKDGNEAPAPPAAGPSSPRPSSSGRPASFAAVSASLASFFSGHSKQSSAEKSDPAAPSQPAVTLHPPSSAADGDTFAPLPPAAVLADLFPDADTRAAVTEFWHERALEWSLDPRTLGGERSASNRGAAALFRLVSSATLTSRRGAAEPGSSVRSSDVASGESSTERDEPPAAAGDRSQDLATSGQRQFQKSYETHDVLRAIEQKDTELLMHIRDINFDLLLDLQSGTSAGLGGGSGAAGVSTPLGYAISLGPTHEGVAIVILGALSRFVNQLPDEVEQGHGGKPRRTRLDPRTETRLRKIKGCLKLSIDHSLGKEQTRLISSYCQVLLMIEGEGFIHDTVQAAQRALLPLEGAISPPPAQVAQQAVERFLNAGLRTRTSSAEFAKGAERIAAVQDLVTNATGDVLLMALWDLVRLRPSELGVLAAEPTGDQQELCAPLPSYFMARDDRIASTFSTRVAELAAALETLGTQASGLKARDRRAWKMAQDVSSALGDGIRRKDSAMRLAAIQSRVARSR